MANQSREKKKEQEANETDTDADKAVKLKRRRHSILSKKKAFSFVKCLARRIPARSFDFSTAGQTGSLINCNPRRLFFTTPH